MSKYGSNRYGQMIRDLGKYVSENNLFDSMVQGAQKPNNILHLDEKTASLTDLMYAFQEHITQLGQLEFADKTRIDILGQAHEEKLENINAEIRSRFEEYKKTHKDFEGADYRKYEYITNVIETYNFQSAQLERSSGYDLAQEVEEVESITDEYEEYQRYLDGAITEFNDYTNDPDYDASFISPEELVKFEGNEVTAETVLNVGTGYILQDAKIKLQELDENEAYQKDIYGKMLNANEKHRVKELEEERIAHDESIKKLADLHAEKHKDINAKEEEFQNKIAEITDPKLNDEYYAAVDEISRIDIDGVSKHLAAGGKPINPNETLSNKWIQDLRTASDDEINSRASDVSSKREKIEQELQETQEMLNVTAANVTAIEAQIKQADEDIKNVENSEEFKKLQEDYENARKDAKEIDDVITSITENGLQSVSQETLSKYGIQYNGLNVQKQAEEEKAEIDNFNKSTRSFNIFKTTPAKTLATGLKDINDAFNASIDTETKETYPVIEHVIDSATGKRERVERMQESVSVTHELVMGKEAEEYAQSHDGKLPFDENLDINDIFDDTMMALRDLEGFDGTLKSKDQAAALNKFFKNSEPLEKFANSIAADAPPTYQKLKKAVSTTIKAFNDIQANRSAYMSIITLAGMAELKGTVADMQSYTVGKLYPQKREMQHKVSMLEDKVMGEFRREKVMQLRENQKNLQEGLEKAKNSVTEIESSVHQKERDIAYLKSAEKVIAARGKLNTVERQTAELQKQYSAIKDQGFTTDKQYTKGIDQIEKTYNDNVKKINAKYAAKDETYKENRERDLAEITEQRTAVTKFSKKVKKLAQCKDGLIEASKKFATKDAALKNKGQEYCSKIAEEKSKVITDLNQLEDKAFDRLAKSPKIGWNSKYFENVITAINNYKAARDAIANGELSKARQAEITADLRREINTYIAERDTGKLKSTSGGQMRIDGMKHILTMLDQKENNLKTFEDETAKINRQVTERKEPKVKSQIVQQLLEQAEQKVVIDNAQPIKENVVKKQVTVAQISKFFEPMTQSIGAKNEYLAHFAESAVKGLAARDNTSFTKAVAAIFAANKLDGLKDEYKTPVVADKLVNLYIKTPKIMELSKQLASGQMKPADFAELAAKPENLKLVHDQASKIKEGKEVNKNNVVQDGPQKGMQ